MIKGNEKGTNEKHVGFTLVNVKAVNPTRAQLNKLLGKEESDEDREINYLTEDQDGNPRVRLSFWLHDEALNKYFVHSFNLAKKTRKSKDGVKTQYVNSTCITAWSDVEENLPDWFTYFISKEGEKLARKVYREALLGEEELVTLLRTWLGKMPWNNFKDEPEVMVDTDALFDENYSELQSLIGGRYDTPFVILTGVRTDENDAEKQYQQVYGKSFLPAGFMGCIEKGMKFPNDWSKKTWDKFEKEVTGDYGFNSYFELEPIKKYNPKNDPAAQPTKRNDVTPVNSKF